VAKAHERGIRVSASANDRDELERLLRIGVDGICCNALNHLTAAVAAAGGVRLWTAAA
jgi:hypothetical protein